MTTFPPASATRAEIDQWLAQNSPPPEPPHEAPQAELNLMCNACEVVRVKLTTPFCKGCKHQLAAAGVEI